MLIELTGCTGVGKSTLIKRLLHSLDENGIIAATGDQFVLQQAKLNWIRNYTLRTILVDFFTLLACLITFKKNRNFYRFVLNVLQKLPKSVHLFEKLNIIRNTFKKLGALEIVRYRNTQQQIVLFDEGTIHTAHYLFVHTSAAPQVEYIASFLNLVPYPDIIIHLQKNASILIDRVLARKHKRIHDLNHNTARKFIQNAIKLFSKIEIHPAVSGRLITVNHQGKVESDSADHLPPSQQWIIKLILDIYQKHAHEKADYKYA